MTRPSTFHYGKTPRTRLPFCAHVISGAVEAMKKQLAFKNVTSDRDLGRRNRSTTNNIFGDACGRQKQIRRHFEWGGTNVQCTFPKTSVNNGRKILFWDDTWLGNGSLKQFFSDIYLLNQKQRATLKKFGPSMDET
ncbi:hypothetical protein H5410_037645 [Solanum commersonii]|uniref:Uncharacterized protein n=1 Tax=Solanum commersonii TaxID=4109 RepID=A0A9J5Y8G1_SOLCO|nr:hypothetical protein H5410_037645 [Solanum commersonii]